MILQRGIVKWLCFQVLPIQGSWIYLAMHNKALQRSVVTLQLTKPRARGRQTMIKTEIQ